MRSIIINNKLRYQPSPQVEEEKVFDWWIEADRADKRELRRMGVRGRDEVPGTLRKRAGKSLYFHNP